MTDSPLHAGSAAGVEAPILVVDDDRQLREIIQWTLEDEGLRVQTAAEGRQAVEQAVRQRPALLILDWGLPLLNGQEVAAAIHQAYDGSVPIVLITADGRTAEKARLIGARDYLHKPFEIDALVTTVHRILGA